MFINTVMRHHPRAQRKVQILHGGDLPGEADPDMQDLYCTQTLLRKVMAKEVVHVELALRAGPRQRRMLQGEHIYGACVRHNSSGAGLANVQPPELDPEA